MADGDYERGRGRELEQTAARLKALAAERARRKPAVLALNGWAASERAWDLCRFARERTYTYIEQLDGEPERRIGEGSGKVVLVGWSMGGSSALRLAARNPRKIAGLVLVAATPRMMEDAGTGWAGMRERRLEALWRGVEMTHGEGLFGVPEGKPNPYMADTAENLERGIKYLRETDLRGEVEAAFGGGAGFPVYAFQSVKDPIVDSANLEWVRRTFPHAECRIVDSAEHALPIYIPEEIDHAVDACIAVATARENT